MLEQTSVSEQQREADADVPEDVLRGVMADAQALGRRSARSRT